MSTRQEEFDRKTKELEENLEESKEKLLSHLSKWVKRWELLAYTMGLLTATFIDLSGHVIDRWVSGAPLSYRYKNYGVIVSIFAIGFIYASVQIVRTKMETEEQRRVFRKIFKK